MYKKFTKETINAFWKCWEDYTRDRLKTLYAVCDDAQKQYLDQANNEMYYMDPVEVHNWLLEQYSSIEAFKREMIDKIVANTGQFVVFLNELARLKFEQRYLNYKCYIDLYGLTWTWEKISTNDRFKFDISTRWQTYDWDKKYERKVQLATPKEVKLTDWIEE